MNIKHDIEKVDMVIEEAAAICCESLDKHFPGYDNGGIDSNFIVKIKETIKAELLRRKLILPED